MRAAPRIRVPSHIIRALDSALIIAALATIPLAVLQIRDVGGVVLGVLDWAIWLVFLAHFVVKLATHGGAGGYPGSKAFSRGNWRDPWAWIDLAVVVLSFPLLPAAFGFTRLVRLVRVGRAGVVGARGLSGTFGRQRLRQMLVITATAILVGGALVSSIEPRSIGGSDLWTGVWWAIVAAAGGGLGAPGPHTIEGRLIGILLMLCGIGIIATTAAFLAESFIGRPPRPRVPERSTQRPVLGREFERAIDYAMDVHGYDIRGREGKPFVGHVLSVAALVIEDGGSQDEAIAALLHDAPEGVEASEVPSIVEGIQRSFGHAVAHIVARCSGPAGDAGWSEQRGRYLESLAGERDARVLRVALAKELDNARSFRRDLAKFGNAAWDGGDGADFRWYYQALSLVGWQGIDSPLVTELRETLVAIRADSGSRIL